MPLCQHLWQRERQRLLLGVHLRLQTYARQPLPIQTGRINFQLVGIEHGFTQTAERINGDVFGAAEC